MGGKTSKDVTTEDTKQQQQSQTSGTTAGTTAQQEAASRNVSLPDYLKSFVPGAIDTSQQALQQFAQGANQYQLPPETLAALRSTAGGDYLYGGPGQQPFIDASVRAALPGIHSQFEMAGRGGGGLETAAIAQQAQDAYAKLYGDERARQLNAATALPGITMMPLQLQQQLAALSGGLPGQFAPFLGANTSGTSSGQTSGTSSQDMSGTSSGTTTTTTPVHETPLWQSLLGAGLGVAGMFAAPGLGGMSAASGLGSALGGIIGSGANEAVPGSGLLGMFR